MKIKIIDFGYKNLPKRAHYNDAGADVFVNQDYILKPGTSTKIPLGFGLELPDGLAAFVFPRSGLSSKGITCELPPIDSGYKGEIHAIVTNCSNWEYEVKAGDRIGQLVIVPFIAADFISSDLGEERGATGFGASGK